MSRVDVIERQVQDLSTEELAEFRRWFEEFDAAVWDQQIECDALAGKLDALAETALQEHADGQSTRL